MKTLLSFAILFCTFSSIHAQPWQAVGPDDFKQISKPGATDPEIFLDSANVPYIIFQDSTTTNFRRTVIKRRMPSGWVQITQVKDTNSNVRPTFTIDKAGSIYYAVDTVIGGAASIIVRKFSSGTWANYGTPYALPYASKPFIKIKLDGNEVPYILYSEYGLNVYPGMIKFNGTNWASLGAIANTSYDKISFDFDSSNAPFVLFHDAFTNARQIKKHDGTAWVFVMNAPPFGELTIHNDSFYISYGSNGYYGGTFSYTPTANLIKFDGNTWVSIADISANNGFAVPYIPITGSTHVVFDNSGNIYLTGGTIWKISGTSITDFGAAGNLAITSNSTFYAAVRSDFNNSKIKVQKRVNNNWKDEFPLSIPPFRGGTLGTYGVYHSYPFYSFFVDKNQHLNIFSRSGSAVSSFINNAWSVMSVTGFDFNSNQSEFQIELDTANNVYTLFNGQYGSYLAKLSGSTWVPFTSSINPNFGYVYFVIDKNNTPFAAMIDNSGFGGDRVRVKKYNGSTWDDVSLVVPFISASASEKPLIVCDSANKISVLYKEGTNLLVKSFDGTNWNAVGNSAANTTSLDYQIKVTGSGEQVVAYLTSLNKPAVTKYNGTNWTTLGAPNFSFGQAKELNLLIHNDTVHLAYTDKILKSVVVTKFDGAGFGLLGSQTISRDSSSNPQLAATGNDVYVSYFSEGIFVKKSASNIILPINPCSTPHPLLDFVTMNSVSIHWTSSTTPTNGYDYALTTTNNIPGMFTNTNNQSFSSNALLPNTTYYFFVRSNCGNSNNSVWDTLSFTTAPLSIAHFGQGKTNIKAYPNPFSNTFQIEGLNPGDQLLLLDVSGRIIRKWKTTTGSIQEFNSADVAPGYYILKVITEKETFTMPVSKY